MDTTLCALMLQVYYRYLPTFQAPGVIDGVENAENAEGEEVPKVIEGQDIPVDVVNNG